MTRVEHVVRMGGIRNSRKIMIGKPEEDMAASEFAHSWKDNIQMQVTGKAFYSVDCIWQSNDIVQCVLLSTRRWWAIRLLEMQEIPLPAERILFSQMQISCILSNVKLLILRQVFNFQMSQIYLVLLQMRKDQKLHKIRDLMGTQHPTVARLRWLLGAPSSYNAPPQRLEAAGIVWVPEDASSLWGLVLNWQWTRCCIKKLGSIAVS